MILLSLQFANLADQVILLDIYPAREQPIRGDIGFDCRATDGAIRAGDEEEFRSMKRT